MIKTLPQDLEDIIMDYKDQIERLELKQKIDENNLKINSVRILCCNKDYLINKSVEDEISYGFNAINGGYLDINYLKNSYEKNFNKIIEDKLDNIRQTNIELQLEKLMKYGKDIISEELDEGLIVIDDDTGIAIGVTGNDYQNNFGIGITNYDHIDYYNFGIGVTN